MAIVGLRGFQTLVRLSITTAAIAPFLPTFPLRAQSIVPALDGTGTQVFQSNTLYNINGGTTAGANLFHSFQTFNLSPAEIANFLALPNIENILGRVVGGDASLLEGLIRVSGSNANLYLMNPAGIVFADGASLDLRGSFLATTADAIAFDGEWFSSGNTGDYSRLLGTPSGLLFSNSQNGIIVNTGNLTVDAGQNLHLSAGTVINTGKLSAPGGNLTLTAVPGGNLARIGAEGSVLSLVVAPTNVSGQISALELPQLLANLGGDATGLQVLPNGRVLLTGADTAVPVEAGTTLVGGMLEVESATQGGRVDVLGEKIGLLGATVNASGQNGGGRIRIGGDFRGRGTLPEAQVVAINANAIARADALSSGNGGSVVVWANKLTHFSGMISARAAAGNGGFVEVSGAQVLDFQGQVDTRAPRGRAGTLLLDPTAIEVVAAGGNAVLGTGNILSLPPATANQRSLLAASAIANATSNVILEADRITINAPIEIVAATVGLTARANNRIAVNANIATNDGAVTLEGGEIAIANATIATGEGDISLAGRGTNGSGGDGISLTNSSLETSGGRISLTGIGGTGRAGRDRADGLIGDKDNLGGTTGLAGGDGGNGGAGIILSNSTISSLSGSVSLTGTGGDGGRGGMGGGGNGGGSNQNSAAQSGGEGGFAGGRGGRGSANNNNGLGGGAGGLAGKHGRGGRAVDRAGGGGGGGGTGGTGGMGSSSTLINLGAMGMNGGAGGGGGSTGTNGGGAGGSDGFGGGGGGSNGGRNGGNGGNGGPLGGNGGTGGTDGTEGGLGTGNGGLGTGRGADGQDGAADGTGGNGGIRGRNNGGGGGGAGGVGGNGGNGGDGIVLKSGSITITPEQLTLNATGGDGGAGGDGGGGGGGGRGVGGGGGGAGGAGGNGGNGGRGSIRLGNFQFIEQVAPPPVPPVVVTPIAPVTPLPAPTTPPADPLAGLRDSPQWQNPGAIANPRPTALPDTFVNPDFERCQPFEALPRLLRWLATRDGQARRIFCQSRNFVAKPSAE